MNKTLPYVYKLTHKITGAYYFGFRSANVVPASDDLGINYFSSSKTIKYLGFENFDAQILAEFTDSKAAFEFETMLIEKHISDPLNLNKAVKGKLFPSRKITTLEHRQNLSKALKGKKPSAETIEKIKKTNQLTLAKMTTEERKTRFGKGGKQAQITIANMSAEERKEKFATMKDKTHSIETRQKISNKNKGKTMSIEARQKMSKAGKGRIQSPEHIQKRSKTFGGGGNPRAIPVTINQLTYPCKKDARIALGWSKNALNRYLADHDRDL